MSTELAGNPETVEEPGLVKRAKGIVNRTGGFKEFTTWFIVISTCENLLPSGKAGSYIRKVRSITSL
jgi:hypothetical protein